MSNRIAITPLSLKTWALNKREMMKVTTYEKKIVLSFAKNNMNKTATSKDLWMHRNTIVYQLNRIKTLYGLDPNNFYDLTELVKKCENQEENP